MLQQSLIAIKVLRSWDATLQTLWLPSKLAGLVPLLGSCQAADLRAASSLPPANTGPNNAKGPDQTTSSNQTPGIHRFCPPAATSMATRGLNASSRVHHIRSPDPNSLMPAPSSAAATSPADTDSASRVSSSCSTPPCETVGAHACSSAAAASPASTDSTSSISSSCTRSPHETVGPHAFSSAAAPSLASAAPKGLLSLHHSTSPSHHAGIHAARLGTASLGPATSPASTGFNALSSLHAGVQQQAQRRVASSASTQAASSSTAVRQGTLPKAGPVAVAISGGVDSAVAALLLKQAGHDIFGIFMRNWDESEEKGNQNCSVEEDLRDAQHICKHLNIPLHEADFIDQYWNRVFSDFVAQYSRGLTPNPDLECNRSIKFDALLEYARGLGAESVATGHYARLVRSEDGGPVQLLKGLDGNKDQSYFLASVPSTALQHFMFPLGSMQKPDVRALASQAGLVSAGRRSSAGLCFIGRRNFADFISGYVEPMTARYVGVASGKDLGECSNLAAVTWGQRAPIGGLPDRCFVVGKDIPNRVVYVTEGGAGQHHSALFTQTALLHSPHWISGEPPGILHRGLPLECSYKARYRQPDRLCQVSTADANTPGLQAAHMGTAFAAEFESSQYTALIEEDNVQAEGRLQVRFQEPAKAVTPQQALVMYDCDVCLGSALVQHPGPSLYEYGREKQPNAA